MISAPPPRGSSGLLLWLALLCLLPLKTFGDTVTLRGPAGPQTLQDALVLMAVRGPQGVPSLVIHLPDGTQETVSTREIERITFGTGEGELFDLNLGDASRPERFPGSTLVSFANGMFVAREPGGSTDYYLQASDVLGFLRRNIPPGIAVPSGVPANTPPADPFAPSRDSASPFGSAPSSNPFGTSPADNPFGSPPANNPFGGPAPTTDPFGGSAVGDPFGGASNTGGPPTAEADSPFGNDEVDEYGMSAEEREELNAALQEAGLGDFADDLPFLVGAGFALLGAMAIYLLLYLLTTVWIAIWAFSNEQAGWGVGILLATPLILLCCAGLIISNTPIKGLMIGKLTGGGGTGVLKVLVIIELILYIGFIVVNRLG